MKCKRPTALPGVDATILGRPVCDCPVPKIGINAFRLWRKMPAVEGPKPKKDKIEKELDKLIEEDEGDEEEGEGRDTDNETAPDGT